MQLNRLCFLCNGCVYFFNCWLHSTFALPHHPKCQNAKCGKRVKEWQRTFCGVKCFRKIHRLQSYPCNKLNIFRSFFRFAFRSFVQLPFGVMIELIVPALGLSG